MQFESTLLYVSSSETNRISVNGEKYTRRVALIVNGNGETLELPISEDVYHSCKSLSMGDLVSVSIDLNKSLKGTFAKIVAINPA